MINTLPPSRSSTGVTSDECNAPPSAVAVEDEESFSFSGVQEGLAADTQGRLVRDNNIIPYDSGRGRELKFVRFLRRASRLGGPARTRADKIFKTNGRGGQTSPRAQSYRKLGRSTAATATTSFGPYVYFVDFIPENVLVYLLFRPSERISLGHICTLDRLTDKVYSLISYLCMYTL